MFLLLWVQALRGGAWGTEAWREEGSGMNHFCDIWYWRASDQEAVARHLRDQARITGEPDAPRRAGLVRSASPAILRTAGLMEQPPEGQKVVESIKWTGSQEGPGPIHPSA